MRTAARARGHAAGGRGDGGGGAGNAGLHNVARPKPADWHKAGRGLRLRRNGRSVAGVLGRWAGIGGRETKVCRRLVRLVRMSTLLTLLCVLTSGSALAQGSHTHGLDLTSTERSHLMRQADEGDSAAAWRLYKYYDLERHNEKASEKWLRRAAALDHAQAQRWLAHCIKDYGYSPSGFGDTAQLAVKSLLEKSARTEGDACFDLALALSEGYFGDVDHAAARVYLERGANLGDRACWTELSHYYADGRGGPRNNSEAYYWISLEARCVDPRSVGGKETWAAREAIAAYLSLEELERAWVRIDAFISQVAAGTVVVDSAPFLSGMIDPELEAEGRQLSAEREAEHRKAWQAKKA